MSKDVENEPSGEEPKRVVLASVNEQYWLVEGSEYLMPLLEGPDGYPTPVECYQFRDVASLQKLLPDGTIVANLWLIHPKIIDRLKANNELVEMPAPPL